MFIEVFLCYWSVRTKIERNKATPKATPIYLSFFDFEVLEITFFLSLYAESGVESSILIINILIY